MTNNNFNEDLHNQYPIDGYDKFYVKSCIRYGGVVIYVKSELQASYFHELTQTCNTHDSLFVKINSVNLHGNKKSKIGKASKALIVGGYYRHCHASEIVNFVDKFNNDLNHKQIVKNDIIIAGDFNICLMKSTHDNDSLLFLNTILSNTCEVHIFKPTRIIYYKNSLQIKSATLIDQVISNLFEYDCHSGNLTYPDSDHHATFVIFDAYKSTKIENSVKYRRFLNKVNDNELIYDFDMSDWNQLVYEEENIDIAVENLNNRLLSLCDKHAPLKKLSNRQNKYLTKPWIDRELADEIKKKNRLYVKKCNVPSEINRRNFNNARNQVTSKIRLKKKKYFQDYFNKFKTNSKRMWDGINLALNQTKRVKSLPTVIKDEKGTHIEGDSVIANSFANYFKNIAAKTKNKIRNYRHPYLHYVNKCKPVDRYLVLNHASEEEVYEHIIKLKNRSSSGPLPVPNEFLKIISKPLAAVLINIINRSMDNGYVPELYKIGKQTPIHKGGETSIDNFRAITVCSSLAKILEKVVRDRVLKFIKYNKILNDNQFGFRKKHNTNHAIINLTESMLDDLDNGLKVGGVFLDIAKAFDTVNHDILLRKLEYYGFRGNTLMWFESYIKHRITYVQIRNCKSKNYSMDWGIPQGGVLAPILFLLFMNDIVKCSNIFKFSIYADDTCIILGLDRENYDVIMKTELKNIVDWFSCNELLLNISKTDYIFFGPHYNNVYDKGECDLSELHQIAPQYLLEGYWDELGDPNYIELNKKGEHALHDLRKVCPQLCFLETVEMPDGTDIYESEQVKYLGVYIDGKITYNHHINIVCCKLNRIVGQLWKGEHLNLEAKLLIYHSLVEFHLSYGITMWGSEFSKNLMTDANYDRIPDSLKNLITVQNKIVRAILRKPKYDKVNHAYTRMSPLYEKLNILKLKELYLYNLGILVHDKFHNKQFPTAIQEKFVSSIAEYDNRSKNLTLNYNKPRLINTYRKPSIAGSMFWNSLPNSIKTLQNPSNFKDKLKKYLISLQ